MNMLEFRKLVLEDKKWVDDITFMENCAGAEYNFGNMFIWRHNYMPRICRFGDRLMMKLVSSEPPRLVYPIGSGPLRPAVEALRAHAEELGTPFVLTGVGVKQRARLEEEFPGCFEYIEEPDRFDYIYRIEKLAEYPGKALHGKRNHCNRFEASHQWEFVPITAELIPKCLEFMESWLLENAERLDPSVSHELDALVQALDNYETLGMEGGALFAEGQMLGFTFGEKCSANSFDVHFEKARAEVNGAYPMVCRELCRMIRDRHPEIEYINREEDMGIEALRYSKQSYKPEFLLTKYTARWIDG